ncbi:hypothetical protein AB0F13_04520 [Streptomyces sp. NPDC026206]|uniref:hypothetical protein n=1 Tax=Streptomyces sp. NPDC026206 TaxID=3157089 RepID=UPI0033CA1D84
MHPPSLPLSAWWIISVLATAIFCAFFIPLMPSRKVRIQICSAPPMAMAFGVACSLVEPMNAEVLLPLYCAVTLAFVLGFLGRQEDVRLGAIEYEKHGDQAEVKGSSGLYVQLVLALVVMTAAGIWLSSAAW